MSKQLTISATASVLAMALFALGTQLDAPASPSPAAAAHMETGATASAIAPAVGRLLPALPSIR